MYHDQLDIDLRVMDLYNGKVLYGNDIPICGEGLLDSIAEFSGQSDEINISTGVFDINKKKIYDQDIISVCRLSSNAAFEIKREKIGEGKIIFRNGAFGVYVPDIEHDIKFIYLHEDDYDFEVIGNRLEYNRL